MIFKDELKKDKITRKMYLDHEKNYYLVWSDLVENVYKGNLSREWILFSEWMLFTSYEKSTTITFFLH